MPWPLVSVRFWGVRGSIPCPGPETVGYGGNTSCVEIRCGDQVLIFDAGTGLRPLGSALIAAGKVTDTDTDIFLSHCHIDHMFGLPFFLPLHAEGYRLRIWAGNLKPAGGVEDAVRKMMSHPLFPIEIDIAKSNVEFCDFSAGETLHPRPGITLRTAPLKHPGGATGYRVEFAGRSIAYLTDTEMTDGPIDPAIVALAKCASLVIIDSTYTDAELPSHAGWGHASWQQCIRLANAAGAQKLCLYHHDPDHDDNVMDEIAAAASAARPGTIVAKEGLCIEL
jgi:phosphoribosyl 1,2-cyclic phosphodiesterase